MKKILCSVSILGLVSALIVGFSAFSARADDECLDPQSPLRGSWSFSQVSEIVPGFGNFPDTAIGVIKVDSCGRYQGHAINNVPCPDQSCFGIGQYGFKNPIQAPLAGQIITHADGTATSTVTVFGTDFVRPCVLMEKQGDCFQEFRCVSGDPDPPNEALLATFKRQGLGACQ